ncbi:bromodomain-containing protein DDB G0270170-like [Aphis craccivora]|uniref:Bromodomain-containing protein DDB G0270170-like n=1 Tax=Aphis craccivora TaxID=307492 RepID=A0A6G0VQ44_APHCR|nr:bromodomain-containing protein DDB G0270170-like [Aphis craccivora]
MSHLDKFCVQNCFGTSKSRFSIPKNSHSSWEMAIGKTLTKRSRVCGNHFVKEDIVNTWVSGESSFSVRKIIFHIN